MRTSLLLALALLVPSSAVARQKTDIAGGSFESLGSAVVRTFDCGETTLDTRGKNDQGFVACLRGLAMDSVFGRSTAVVEAVIDSKDPLGDLEDLKLMLRLDSGRTERTLEDFVVARTHEGEASSGVAELFLSDWLEPSELVDRKPEDERQHLTLAWNFQTWDPSIDLKFIQLKAVGKGVGGTARWTLDGGLGHDGEWSARPEFVWDDDMADVACSMWRIRKGDADKASDALSDGANKLPLQMRFEVLSNDEDSQFEVNFPDHKFLVAFDGGKLKVRGREDFTHPLGDSWRTGDEPNVMELVYDGTFVTVRVNDLTFGPMAGKRREGKRFRWEFAFEDGKNELRNLDVAPCTLEDPEDWVAPEPKKRAEPVAAASRGGGVRAGGGGMPAGGGGGRKGSGKVIQSVVSRNGQVVNEVRKKRKKSALEVMTTAASIGQGLMAAGQGLSQFGQDVQTNMNAMESGDYESMKSSDTQIDIGPCGSSVTRSEASISGVETGSPTIDMAGEKTTYGNPGCANGQPISDLLPPEAIKTEDVCTLTVVAEAGGKVVVGGEVLGVLREGDRWVAQVTPGSHKVVFGGDALGELIAGAGSTVTLRLGEAGTADPPEAWRD